MQQDYSCRHMLIAAGTGLLIPGHAFAADPVIGETTIAARRTAPVIAKNVNGLFNLRPSVRAGYLWRVHHASSQAGDLPPASGGHGVKWAGHGQCWMAVPASGKLFLMNAQSGTVARSIPAPIIRTHGIAPDGDHIWCVGGDEAEITKLRMADGAIVAKIVLDKANDPAPHGLDIRDGVLWYCDADKGWVCNLT